MQFQWYGGAQTSWTYDLSGIMSSRGSTGLILRHPDGRELRNNGNTMQLSSGNAVALSISRPTDLYGYSSGFVALNDGSGFLRHAGQVMYSHGYVSNNFDFAWKFRETSDGRFLLQNDWSGTSWMGYDAGSDRLMAFPSGDSRIIAWTIVPSVSSAYVTPI
jgi:hypothetical protein